MGAGYLNERGYTDAVDTLVVAFCKSYSARAEAIKKGEYSKRTLMEYKYMNARISDAAREVAGNIFEQYIYEIGVSVGYSASSIELISEYEYKKTKREVKINIAKKMHLID